MRWTDRQRAMLREMGVRLWEREPMPLATAAVLDDDVREAANEPPRRVPPPAVVAPRAPVSVVRSDIDARTDPDAASNTTIDSAWRPADWLIVGEPFDTGADGTPAGVVGEQERLLAHMLQAIGVARDAPERAARACHIGLAEGTHGRLDDALEHVGPRLILALGRAAAEAVLGIDEPIGRLRGQVHARAGTRVVVSFALAYLLRHPAEKAKAWADLCLAVRSLEGEGKGESKGEGA